MGSFNANGLNCIMRNIARALRLPFLCASTLPFIFGSLISKQNFNFLRFFLGLVAVATMHLSANLMNDYADSKSGLDWQDKGFYKFFGGSKLIQEGLLSEKFYFSLSLFFAFLSAISIIILALSFRNFAIVGFYFFILFLAWAYSARPLQFSYHGWGEVVIFVLFGPALVMGGYFIQTKIFPALSAFLLSLPFGFFTTAILFANEVPDSSEDKKMGKFTWVGFTGKKYAFILYLLLISLGFLSVSLNIALGYLKPLAALSFVFIIPAIKAINTLKRYPNEKIRLMDSSRLTIAVQTMVGINLILVAIL
jgi:1,4-dihydroxy-2-naphthoate octaprenyltransferase